MHDLQVVRRRLRAVALLLAVVAWAFASAAAAQGAEIYENQCATCHGPSGEGGGAFPSLVGSEVVLGDAHALLALPLQGAGAMPGFATTLTDAEIADVSTYVRTSWGNDAGEIDAATVAEVRDELGADPGPEPAEEAEEPAEPEDADEPDDADAEEAPEEVEWDAELGAQVYGANCAACHGVEGQGVPGAFPALAGNAFLNADAPFVIHVPMYGRAGMPAFGGLSDEEMAAVVSYMRTSWGNDAGAVTVEQVEEVRDGPSEIDPDDPTFRPGAAN